MLYFLKGICICQDVREDYYYFDRYIYFIIFVQSF